VCVCFCLCVCVLLFSEVCIFRTSLLRYFCRHQNIHVVYCSLQLFEQQFLLNKQNKTHFNNLNNWWGILTPVFFLLLFELQSRRSQNNTIYCGCVAFWFSKTLTGDTHFSLSSIMCSAPRLRSKSVVCDDRSFGGFLLLLL